jgi:hypothetical protein
MIRHKARFNAETQRCRETADGAAREFESLASPRLSASALKLLLIVLTLSVPV